MRRRNIPPPPPPSDNVDGQVGIEDLASKSPNKSQQQQQHESEEPELPEAAKQPKEKPPVPGTWSPLLTNVCLCTALALSAYACYRACFHWCPSPQSSVLCSSLCFHWCFKVDVAGQSACLDSASEWILWCSADSLVVNFTNAVGAVGWLLLITHLLSLRHLGCSGPQFFRCHIINPT